MIVLSWSNSIFFQGGNYLGNGHFILDVAQDGKSRIDDQPGFINAQQVLIGVHNASVISEHI